MRDDTQTARIGRNGHVKLTPGDPDVAFIRERLHLGGTVIVDCETQANADAVRATLTPMELELVELRYWGQG
jgi:hypothetical protein